MTLPDWLQWMTETNPITHFIILNKGLLLKDLPPALIFRRVWPMALTAMFTLAVGAWMFRRKTGS